MFLFFYGFDLNALFSCYLILQTWRFNRTFLFIYSQAIFQSPENFFVTDFRNGQVLPFFDCKLIFLVNSIFQSLFDTSRGPNQLDGAWRQDGLKSNPFKKGEPFDVRFKIHEDHFQVSFMLQLSQFEDIIYQKITLRCSWTKRNLAPTNSESRFQQSTPSVCTVLASFRLCS